MTKTRALRRLIFLAVAWLPDAMPVVSHLAAGDERIASLVPVSDDDFDETARFGAVAPERQIQFRGRAFVIEGVRRLSASEAFDAVVFGAPEAPSITTAALRLGLLAEIKIVAMESACGLTAEQRQKLRVAAEGDIKRLFDEVGLHRQRWEAATESDSQPDLPGAIHLRSLLTRGSFGPGSLVDKALIRVVPATQRAKCREIVQTQHSGAFIHVRTSAMDDHEVTEIRLTGGPLGDDSLKRIARMTKLKVLYLDSTRVTDRGLGVVTGLNDLEILSLSETLVTDRGIRDLMRLQSLRELDLGATRVTDAGLAQLAGLSNLRTLDLRRARVSDAGLAHLKALPNLKYVYLYGTQVTEAGVADLQASLPGTKLVW